METSWVSGGQGLLCESILTELPEWFGLPESNADYARKADEHPGVIASIDGQALGITTVVRHGQQAAEVYLMAVRPSHHRRGVGQAMLDLAEAELSADGVEFLQVKTLGPSHGDAGYALTRAFYFASGFRVLEEHTTLWGPDNPALQLIKVIRSSSKT